jgi:uncharacterized protein YbjT (DUF2867 family)
VLSVVGTGRLLQSAYFRAKFAQEELVKDSSVPYTIVQTTQFFESLGTIADAATHGNAVPGWCASWRLSQRPAS